MIIKEINIKDEKELKRLTYVYGFSKASLNNKVYESRLAQFRKIKEKESKKNIDNPKIKENE